MLVSVLMVSINHLLIYRIIFHQLLDFNIGEESQALVALPIEKESTSLKVAFNTKIKCN